jgi:hypothetical protein
MMAKIEVLLILPNTLSTTHNISCVMLSSTKINKIISTEMKEKKTGIGEKEILAKL